MGVELNGRQWMTRSGMDIVATLTHADPLAREGIAAIQRLTTQMGQSAGDGTKVAALIATRMIERATAAVGTGLPIPDLIAGMESGTQRACEALRVETRPTTGALLRAVASTAALDQDLGARIHDAFEASGRNGIINVEGVASNQRIRLATTVGMPIDRGLLHPGFATEPDARTAVLDDCYVLVSDLRVAALRDVLSLLENVIRTGRPLLLIVADLDGEALATLLLNHKRGKLKCAAIKAPGPEATRRAWLNDIAAFTGGTAIDSTLTPLSNVSLDDLGRARVVQATQDSATIVGGAGTAEHIEARANEIRAEIDASTDQVHIERAQVRLAALCGGIVTLEVGGRSPSEREHDRRRTVAGVHAAYSAIRHGCVAGGGVALARIRKIVDVASESNAARKAGLQAVERALEEPLRVLANSIGQDETAALGLADSAVPSAWNVLTRSTEDLFAAGILDPMATLERAIQLAMSVSHEVLETQNWRIADDSRRGTNGES